MRHNTHLILARRPARSVPAIEHAMGSEPAGGTIWDMHPQDGDDLSAHAPGQQAAWHAYVDLCMGLLPAVERGEIMVAEIPWEWALLRERLEDPDLGHARPTLIAQLDQVESALHAGPDHHATAAAALRRLAMMLLEASGSDSNLHNLFKKDPQ